MSSISDGPTPLPEGFSEDYEALRHRSGFVAVERDVLRVSGPDALEYLQGQCSQDLAPLGPGSAVDALVLEPQGKLDALVRVTRTAEDEFFLDTAGGYGELVRARLARFKLRVKVEIEPVHWRCLALRGTEAAPDGGGAVTGSLTSGTSLALPYSWNGLVGADLLGDDPQAPEGARACGRAALESRRIEAGIPEMGTELDERTIAAEAGLLERCVSFTKGCYTGQELIARLDARGNRVAKRLRGLVVDPARAPELAPGALVGSEVVAGEKVVGSVTSAAWAPTLGSVAALAYLHRGVDPPCEVELRGSDGKAGAGVRVAADARELPLVR